jgi:hypothetical protein
MPPFFRFLDQKTKLFLNILPMVCILIFLEQKKFFNLNINKYFLTKQDQKLRDPQKKISV